MANQNHNKEELRLLALLESIQEGGFDSIEITILEGKPVFVRQYSKKNITIENLEDIVSLCGQIGYGTIKVGLKNKNIKEIIKTIKLNI